MRSTGLFVKMRIGQIPNASADSKRNIIEKTIGVPNFWDINGGFLVTAERVIPQSQRGFPGAPYGGPKSAVQAKRSGIGSRRSRRLVA